MHETGLFCVLRFPTSLVGREVRGVRDKRRAEKRMERRAGSKREGIKGRIAVAKERKIESGRKWEDLVREREREGARKESE